MTGWTWDMVAVHEDAPGQCPPDGVLPYMHVCRRDRAHGMLLMGGMGVMRVGHMWCPDSPALARHPGYEDAPHGDCPDYYLPRHADNAR